MVHDEACVKTAEFSGLAVDMTEAALDLSASMNGLNLCYNQSETKKIIRLTSRILNFFLNRNLVVIQNSKMLMIK